MTEKWTRIEVDHPAVVEMWRDDDFIRETCCYRGKVIVGSSVVEVYGSGITYDDRYDEETDEYNDGYQAAFLYPAGRVNLEGFGTHSWFWEDDAESTALYRAVADLLLRIAGVS